MKKQLKLFEPFFNEEIDFKNDYVSYIDTSSNNVTSVIHHNIKKLLKTKKFINNLYIYRSKIIDIYFSFHISKSQSHNGMSSLM